MGAKQNEQKGANFFALKAKTSDTDPTPFIGKSEKIGGEWKTTERFNSFDGNLTDIEAGDYIYKNEKKYVCKLSFKDDDGTKNFLQINFNNLLYSFLNALQNCEPGKIEIQVYLGKAKMGADGKMGKQYPGIALKNNGADVKWKYPFAELPKPERTKVKAGNKMVEVSDDSKVIEHWIDVINNVIRPVLLAKAPTVTTEKSLSPIADAEPILSPNDDDLPF